MTEGVGLIIISEIVRTISYCEWIIYYYADNPWSVENSDCVSRMTFRENKEEKIANFELVATPLEYDKGDVNRMKSSIFVHCNPIQTFSLVDRKAARKSPIAILPNVRIQILRNIIRTHNNGINSDALAYA